jgi:hypothetical protein
MKRPNFTWIRQCYLTFCIFLQRIMEKRAKPFGFLHQAQPQALEFNWAILIGQPGQGTVQPVTNFADHGMHCCPVYGPLTGDWSLRNDVAQEAQAVQPQTLRSTELECSYSHPTRSAVFSQIYVVGQGRLVCWAMIQASFLAWDSQSCAC